MGNDAFRGLTLTSEGKYIIRETQVEHQSCWGEEFHPDKVQGKTRKATHTPPEGYSLRSVRARAGQQDRGKGRASWCVQPELALF